MYGTGYTAVNALIWAFALVKEIASVWSLLSEHGNMDPRNFRWRVRVSKLCHHKLAILTSAT